MIPIIQIEKLIDVMYLHVIQHELIINRNIPYILNFNSNPAKSNDIEVVDSRCTSGNHTIKGNVGILISKGIIISKLSKQFDEIISVGAKIKPIVPKIVNIKKKNDVLIL